MPRTDHNPEPDDLAKRRWMHRAAVGATMLVIVGLYAASFRYQRFSDGTSDELPRWSALTGGLADRAAPLKDEFEDVKAKILLVANAHETQAAATENLKKKLEALNAASSTPSASTGAGTETPETL